MNVYLDESERRKARPFRRRHIIIIQRVGKTPEDSISRSKRVKTEIRTAKLETRISESGLSDGPRFSDLSGNVLTARTKTDLAFMAASAVSGPVVPVRASVFARLRDGRFQYR